MVRTGRRILLVVEPVVLEGALAEVLSIDPDHEVVQLRLSSTRLFHGFFDGAIISDQLPDNVRAGVVITLPDTRGSAGIGTVTAGDAVLGVRIDGVEQVVELLQQYVPRRQLARRATSG